ncbi:hypothetical protein CK203_039136 [Vitis vinifera]|uniref:Uncharacterized protein n=1 Tax=Vitis vinifera TaxID=29760 RepID=A0A438DQR1_VITVI|nr:hypothetical protein CK203_100844 [Vitis vinifera]RVW95537.1 hypothetical protein CK203_039136 [Vitis vinifera]
MGKRICFSVRTLKWFKKWVEGILQAEPFPRLINVGKERRGHLVEWVVKKSSWAPKKRITEAKVSKEAIELDDIEQGKVQVSETLKPTTILLAKKGKSNAERAKIEEESTRLRIKLEQVKTDLISDIPSVLSNDEVELNVEASLPNNEDAQDKSAQD